MVEDWWLKILGDGCGSCGNGLIHDGYSGKQGDKTNWS